MNGTTISSRKLIAGLSKALHSYYPTTTRVRRAGEAASIILANDLGFDVVPCFSLKPRSIIQESFYLIPDGNDGWIRTNPRIDTQMSELLHVANNKTLRKAVKLFKWWNGQFIGGRVDSYFAELAVMRAFEALNRSGRMLTAVPEAVDVAFKAIHAAASTGAKDPLLFAAPAVEPGDVTHSDLQRLAASLGWCQLAVSFEAAGRMGNALACWKQVFGESFPSE